MTSDMWLAMLILVTAIVLFITEWVRVDVVALGVVVALMLSGLITTQEAISGFANSAVLTIAALFVVGGAILQTGLAGAIGQRILQVAGQDPLRLTLVIMAAVAMLSGFMSDTGTVAVLLPAIASLALNARISASKLLIPLAFGALLGGALTLIGTPPNILVSDLLREQGLTPFGFFDYTPIGLVLLCMGLLFMLLIGRRWLPDYQPKMEVQRVETPEELLDIYRLPDNLFRLRVRRGSLLVGKTIKESNLGRDFGVTIIDVYSTAEKMPETKTGESNSISLSTSATINVSDILLVQGAANDVGHAAAAWNLGVQPALEQDEASLITNEAGIAEVLLPPRSSLVGKTLGELRFGSTYHLTVLDIHRPGAAKKLTLKDTKLSFGDTLLVQGSWQNILALRKQRRDFVVMGEPEEMVTAPTRSKAPLALIILVGMLALMATSLIPVVTASLLAALAMILTGCLTIDDAYAAVDWKSIVLVAGMIPMSIALESVGVVGLVSQVLTDTLGQYDPLLVLGGLFLITSGFTQVLSNTATTVLIAPIGLATAHQMGVQPYAFLMGIAIAASMAFATPVASPVNTLVMGAGSYRFSDYLKIGVPLIILMLLVSIIAIPLLWPFY